MTVATQGITRAPRPSSLADVLDVVLDKGIVIDAYVRVAVVGIELVTIDARIVVASVDTYLRFAEAVNRLDLQPTKQVSGLPGMMEEITEAGAESKTKGALSGVRDTAKDMVSTIKGDEQDESSSAPAERSAPAKRSSSRSRKTSERGSEDD